MLPRRALGAGLARDAEGAQVGERIGQPASEQPAVDAERRRRLVRIETHPEAKPDHGTLLERQRRKRGGQIRFRDGLLVNPNAKHGAVGEWTGPDSPARLQDAESCQPRHEREDFVASLDRPERVDEGPSNDVLGDLRRPNEAYREREQGTTRRGDLCMLPAMPELDLRLADGRTLHVRDTGLGDPAAGLTLVWHHGSPQTGAPLAPLVQAARRRQIRLLSYGRPSYGGSSPQVGRSVAAAAADVRGIVDTLGVASFAVMGASGGGPHALACAALLPDRVVGAVTLAGIAPFTDEFDWYAGMAAPGGLRSATEGREARARFAETDVFDESSFTAADWATLQGAWSSLGADAGRAGRAGPDGLIDDDVAFVHAWDIELDQIRAPVLLVQGGEDRVVPRSHAEWLLGQIPTAELWLRPRDGHISVLQAVPVAMDWLRGLVLPA